MNKKPRALLLVANWDSGTGYAWWLMKSFWLLLSDYYSTRRGLVFLAYPSISVVPEDIESSEIIVKQMSFNDSSLASLWGQCRFIRKHNIETIYFSDHSSCSLKYLLFHLIGVQHIIVHDHTPGVRSVPGKIKKILKTALRHVPLICVDGLIAVSKYVKKRHIEVTCMPRGRCYCAENGLPDMPDVKALDIVKEFGVPANRRVMVTTGRASVYKGIDFSLAVLSALIHEHGRGDVHYLFCGDGSDLDVLKKRAIELDVEEYVTFTGRVQSVYPYLKACDFAIHPSKGEVGYSLSILEYMQAGLPVIVPDNPSVCGETANEVTGYIYREGDVADAANKVIELLNAPELMTSMGLAAEDVASKKHKLSDTHSQLLRAIVDIMSK